VNGVARAYWAEMLDLRLAVEPEREKRPSARRKKLLRTRTLASRPRRSGL
jgi:hypothetical protein